MRWNQTVAWVMSCVFLCAGAANAQDSATASKAQRKLIEQGLKAHAAEDYASAIAHFRGANEGGELNIIWLNLGRALQKSGDCAGAKDAFARALTAPAVPRP